MDEFKKSTLSGRVDALFARLIKEAKALKFDSLPFISRRQYCIVCGILRFDQDPSGLTCGSERCLCELEKEFEELNEDATAYHDLAKTAGLIKKDGTINGCDLEGMIEDHNKMLKTLKEIAGMLEIEISDYIEGLCDEVSLKLKAEAKDSEKMRETLKEIAKDLNSEEGDSIEDFCDEIETEVASLRAAIERLGNEKI